VRVQGVWLDERSLNNRQHFCCEKESRLDVCVCCSVSILKVTYSSGGFCLFVALKRHSCCCVMTIETATVL